MLRLDIASDYEPSVMTAQFRGDDEHGEETDSHIALGPPVLPRWRQPRFQLAAIGLITVAGAAAAIGYIVVSSVGSAFTSPGTGSATNAAEEKTPVPVPISPAPSMALSATPSFNPSTLPSFLPSKLPSMTPSISPSQQPSIIPSISPSQQPSISPTSFPTRSISKSPSKSASPTSSGFPTLRPSASPSKLPTQVPSQSPSTLPTNIPSATPSTAAPSASSKPSDSYEETFGFYVMGDTPYAPWEESMLLDQLTEMTTSRRLNTHFTVHVGDFQKPARTNCDPKVYENMANHMSTGPLPTFVLPGDNDWFDCPKAMQSLDDYREHVTYLEDRWYNSSAVRLPEDVVHMDVEHAPEYPELWSFYHQGIMFLSVHLIDTKPEMLENGGKTSDLWVEWNDRMAANIAWFWRALADYGQDAYNGDEKPLKAIILFGHGQISVDTREFFEAIRPAFFSFSPALQDLPILYLHGDGHNWDTDDRIRTQLDWEAFIDIQVDQGALADPLIVEVATNPDVPLVQEHALQYIFADGLFRIDRQRGRYPPRQV